MQMHTSVRQAMAFVSVLTLLVAASPAAAQSPTPQTTRPMKIGFIGAGNIGGAIGALLAKAGHDVFFSSRNPDSLKDLVARVGPYARAGQIVIDAGNPRVNRDGPMAELGVAKGVGLATQEYLPKARIVRALHQLNNAASTVRFCPSPPLPIYVNDSAPPKRTCRTGPAPTTDAGRRGPGTPPSTPLVNNGMPPMSDAAAGRHAQRLYCDRSCIS